METASKFLIPGIIFLLTLASGFWLSSSGKPYSAIIFNIHKFIALAVVIFSSIQVSKVLKAANPQALFIGLIILVGLCVVALFASGAFMSLGKLDQKTMLTIHQAAPYIAAASLSAALYLLVRQ